ncbi:4-hydroxy-3-polyprenylbenzoate decarboxylase [Persephonella hydrogeniphila]|uniref:Flavin prenyltransferase UbiX n=1 Tax=Persephonella hydrogeniphila TaxID=198703 RepID=A0A285N4P9_9AQUI|nr:UbiX family flavin prenyltransferase [Persephonella hydrogeniphila]SNZ03913.1 4-hydroxy-3-polyprenylbenzoate decarboxylase [Persephonella hydrogeniphila]
MEKIVLCITGASGFIYGERLLRELCRDHFVYLVISDSAFKVMEEETDRRRDDFLKNLPDNVHFFSQGEIDAPISSGSRLIETKGVIVAPCSTGTLGAVAGGISNNLIHRVCDVALKERKKVYLLLREMPLSLIQIKNMEKVTLSGGTVAVASPGFYTKPESVDDMINFVVGKVLDFFDINHNLYRRWKDEDL